MYNPLDVSRIDRQIEDLQRMKANIQGYNPPPINNIITTPQQQIAPTVPIFEAKFSTENPNDVFIKNKTAFINLKDNKLSIKEIDGEVKEYQIVPPKDEKDLRIEQLESEIYKLKQNYTNLQQVNTVEQNLPQPVISQNYAQPAQYVQQPVSTEVEDNYNISSDQPIEYNDAQYNNQYKENKPSKFKFKK